MSYLGASRDKRKRGRESHGDNSYQNHNRYPTHSSNTSAEINAQKNSDVQSFMPQPQPAPLTPKLPFYMLPFPPPIQFSSMGGHQFTGYDG